MVADIARLEDRIDRVAAGSVEISDALGGVRFQNMLEVMEFAKLMACSGSAIPKHLQANPGGCLAVTIQALEWGFSPFSVASQHYDVGGRAGYMSQLIHAVIEKRAPIIGRLRHRFEGDGDERICIVWAQVRGETEPLEYRSPPFGKILPKNSPLWKTKPDLQHYYNTSRDYCRVYFPDVLLGVYTEDELRDSHIGPDYAKDVSPKPDIGKRLKGGKAGQRGFSEAHVERETGGKQEQQSEAVGGTGQASADSASVEGPSNDAAGGGLAPVQEEPPQTDATENAEGRAAVVDDAVKPQPTANIFASYASELYEVKPSGDAKKDQAAFKKAEKAFWDENEYPTDDEAAKNRLSAIHAVHVKRLTGQLTDKQVAEELRELVA